MKSIAPIVARLCFASVFFALCSACAAQEIAPARKSALPADRSHPVAEEPPAVPLDILAASPEDAYRLEVSSPAAPREADLYLLPDQSEVELSAELVRSAPLPPRVRERSRQIFWESEAGDIRLIEAGDSAQRIRWKPPNESRPVRVAANALVIAEGEEGPEQIRKTSALRFLSPVSSSRLVDGYLDGYHLGEFPSPDDPKLREMGFEFNSPWYGLHPDRYRKPDFFYRVERETTPLRISPHLTLGHFAIDFPWKTLGMPQYVAIDLHLVEKLEDVMRLMREDGHAIAGITPIYGYRPPSFNLGTILEHPESTKKVVFSMHQYGRAMDFIVDEDGDLIMDDLNGDGTIDMRDPAVVMHYVNILDRQYRAEERWAMVGGAGLYDSHDFIGRPQSPYIHVDTRGFQSESGILIRWPDRWPNGEPIRWGDI